MNGMPGKGGGQLGQDEGQKRGQKRGQRKTQDPCENCFLHRDRCICAFIPNLSLKTRVSLIIHAKELKRTTNTGLLATKALSNSQVCVRGARSEEGNLPLDLSSLLDTNYRPVLFYPSEDAIDLNADFVQRSSLPVHLIVPDGNWRQASKVHYRHPELRDIPRVMIKTLNSSAQHIRAETSAHGMATLQAIAHALGVIEGDSVKAELLGLYQRKLEQTLLGRGVSIIS